MNGRTREALSIIAVRTDDLLSALQLNFGGLMGELGVVGPAWEAFWRAQAMASRA